MLILNTTFIISFLKRYRILPRALSMCGVYTHDTGVESKQMAQKPIRPIERQRMRPWLENLLNTKVVTGLYWTDEKEKIFEIPWRHGSRHGWSSDKDADLFERWAKHTGRHEVEKPNPKKWKANFRCALNSLADVKDITTISGRYDKESKCVKIYQFIDTETTKREGRRPYKRRKISTDSESSSTCSFGQPLKSEPITRTYIKNEVKEIKEESKPDIKDEFTQETPMPLPDSTSSDFVVDQSTIKQETPVEVQEVELPFKPSEDFDIEIDHGVLKNHMSGFIMIRTSCPDRLLETFNSDFNSFSWKKSGLESIPCSRTSTKRSFENLEYCGSDSQNISPCESPEYTSS